MKPLMRHLQSHRAKAETLGADAADCQDEGEVMRLSSLAQLHATIADAIEDGERELDAVFR